MHFSVVWSLWRSIYMDLSLLGYKVEGESMVYNLN